MLNKPIGANRLLHVFGTEVVDSEEVISEAFASLCRYTDFSNPPPRLIHRAVRQILAESSIVSLVFFPPEGSGSANSRAQSRAEFLRAKFNVDDDSTLKNRAVRNHIAHLDQRLDSWAMKSTNKTFGRSMLGSRSDAIRIGLADEDILGLFDPRTFVFSFLSHDLQLDDLVGEIRDISHTVRKSLRNLPGDEEAH